METWDKLKTPPASAIKKIQAGRLKGKSDINPQWRYQAMTETFGPCGSGWKFEIQKTWVSEGSDKQLVQNVQILLYVLDNGKWSEPIPGVGGSMLVAKEKNGLYTNDEAVKMALTDALGVAMKMLGMAADVYRGMWESLKHNKANQGGEVKTYKNFEFLEQMKKYKVELGEEDYYSLLGKHGYERSNEIPPANQEGALKAFSKKLQQVVEAREAKV